jgi:medium-chain acyl-[acyl-carrier-protein] hydrolase
MGALLTFEVARALRRRSAPLPFLLFLSAYPAAHLPRTQAPVNGLPAEVLIARLREMEGTPEAVLNDRELMNFLLPTIRADFELCETCRYHQEPPLPIPIIAFGGERDLDAPPGRMEAWRQHTSSQFTHYTLPGGHFFLNTSRQRLLDYVVAALQAGL